MNLTFYSSLLLRTSVLYFLGIFSLIFAVLKIIKLSSFVDSFVEYDFISKKLRAYAYAFPFLELLFGLTFILNFEIVWIELACLIFYTINLVSVINALLQKKKFVCACLGGLFNVPLSYVSLAENLTMLSGILFLFITR
jgi:hypothetical protein